MCVPPHDWDWASNGHYIRSLRRPIKGDETCYDSHGTRQSLVWPGLVEEGERDENPMAPDGTYAENYLKLITQVITNIINRNMILLEIRR